MTIGGCYAPVKRAIDFLVAGGLIAMTAPLWLVVALSIRLSDGGPVFFGQQRLGLNDRPFTMWKFRTMVPDASRVGGYQTLTGDSRITPIGRWLRRTSIDELPQLLNVLKGDMSLVGPRPDVPRQREAYDPDAWVRRCSVRPGMTGLAQVMHKRNGKTRPRIEYDLEYVARRGPMMDLRIALCTIGTVLALRNS